MAKGRGGQGTKGRSTIDEVIAAGKAGEVLRGLVREDPGMAERIEELARERLSDVDIEGIADWVYSELDVIDVHDLWWSSGSTRHGYVDVTDRAWDMFDEALEPVRDEMERYRRLSMRREETVVLMGMLKGLYDYERESGSEFKDWAVDAPRDRFDQLLEDWRDGCEDLDERSRVEDYLEKEVPEWAGE